MKEIRRQEQRFAAQLGQYGIQIQLDYSSAYIKQCVNSDVTKDLLTIFSNRTPEIIYLHQPTDKHSIHVAVFVHCILALRQLPINKRPNKVIGCEVWTNVSRDLDWLDDNDKIILDVGQHSDLSKNLLCVFDSQINGGKRYDLATLGRRTAHATFNASHATDKYQAVTLAMDLTPLITDTSLSIVDYTMNLIDNFKNDVKTCLNKLIV